MASKKTERKNTTKNKPENSVVGRVKIDRQYRKDPSTSKDRDLEVYTFPTGVEPAYVRASYGLTINLGNYEFARCDVAVTLPCAVEEMPEALKEAWKIAKREIREQTKDVKSNE